MARSFEPGNVDLPAHMGHPDPLVLLEIKAVHLCPASHLHAAFLFDLCATVNGSSPLFRLLSSSHSLSSCGRFDTVKTFTG